MNPLHQFEIHRFVDIGFGDFDLSFSNSSLAMVLGVVCVFLLFYLGIKNSKIIPGRLQALAEMAYQLVASMLKDNVGTAGLKYFPFVFSVFFFVLFGNLLGLIPYMFTYTSHIIVTFSLAMIVFLFITVIGFVLHGAKFFGYFVPKGVPWPLLIILVPIELISYFSRPISLSVRLFANMMAGHAMMKVFASFCVLLGIFGIAPMVVNIALTGFEMLIACLQAYVFTVLTCLYINDAVHLH